MHQVSEREKELQRLFDLPDEKWEALEKRLQEQVLTELHDTLPDSPGG